MPDDADTETASRNQAAPKPSDGVAGRLWQWLRPLLRQSVLNLRVWLPILATPEMKRRQVKYRARESRTGTKWQISLPEQCWQCGQTAGLERREFSRAIRRFDSPLSVLSGTLALAGMLLLPWLFLSSWKFVALALLVLIGGGVLLGIKSWKERVRLTAWTCSQHAQESLVPAMASGEDDLYVFAASEALAEVARAELQAARRRDSPGGAASRRSASEASPAEVPPPPALPPVPVRAELPPLKLGGDAESVDAPPRPSAPSGPVRGELPPLKLAGDDDEPS